MDDDVRMAALFCVRHLTGDQTIDLRIGQRAASTNAMTLDICRGRHHDEKIDLRSAAALQQQRYVKQGEAGATGAGAGEKAPLLLTH